MQTSSLSFCPASYKYQRMIGLLSQHIRVVCCARDELGLVVEDVGRFFVDLLIDVEQVHSQRILRFLWHAGEIWWSLPPCRQGVLVDIVPKS